MIGFLSLQIHLPGCASLKEKRSRLRPILARLHKEFNISAAEVEHLDSWQETLIGFAVVSNDQAHARQVLENVVGFVSSHWPDEQIIEHRIEMI